MITTILIIGKSSYPLICKCKQVIYDKYVAYKHYKKSPNCKIYVHTIDETILNKKYIDKMLSNYNKTLIIPHCKILNEAKQLEYEFDNTLKELENDFANSNLDEESYRVKDLEIEIAKSVFDELKKDMNVNN